MTIEHSHIRVSRASGIGSFCIPKKKRARIFDIFFAKKISQNPVPFSHSDINFGLQIFNCIYIGAPMEPKNQQKYRKNTKYFGKIQIFRKNTNILWNIRIFPKYLGYFSGIFGQNSGWVMTQCHNESSVVDLQVQTLNFQTQMANFNNILFKVLS